MFGFDFSPSEESYLSFIVQAEKLDGFMRERESQDKIFGADSCSQRGRDDDASRSMYQMKLGGAVFVFGFLQQAVEVTPQTQTHVVPKQTVVVGARMVLVGVKAVAWILAGALCHELLVSMPTK